VPICPLKDEVSELVKPNIYSIILYVGTAATALALAYASLGNATIAWSVGICIAIAGVIYLFRLVPPPKKRSGALTDGAAPSRSPAASAGAVLVVVFGLILVVPTVVMWIGKYSPVTAAVIGGIALMAIFGILWLRARYQQSRDGE